MTNIPKFHKDMGPDKHVTSTCTLEKGNQKLCSSCIIKLSMLTILYWAQNNDMSTSGTLQHLVNKPLKDFFFLDNLSSSHFDSDMPIDMGQANNS